MSQSAFLLFLTLILGFDASAASLDQPSEALVAELMAMPDHPTRRALLVAKLGSAAQDPVATKRLSTALSVVAELEGNGTTDPAAIRQALVAALDGSEVTSAGASTPAASAAVPAGPPGVVCVGRPFNVVGAALGYDVTINGRYLGRLKAGTFLRASVPSGQVEVRAQTSNNPQVVVDVAAGKTSYVKAGLLWGSETMAGLEPLPAADARFAASCEEAPLGELR